MTVLLPAAPHPRLCVQLLEGRRRRRFRCSISVFEALAAPVLAAAGKAVSQSSLNWQHHAAYLLCSPLARPFCSPRSLRLAIAWPCGGVAATKQHHAQPSMTFPPLRPFWGSIQEPIVYSDVQIAVRFDERLPFRSYWVRTCVCIRFCLQTSGVSLYKTAGLQAVSRGEGRLLTVFLLRRSGPAAARFDSARACRGGH